MPWIKDENGENKYRVSIYAKEELPTWSEVYEEFYKGKCFRYDPNTDKEMDPYWNIPRTKYLIATACNQFNKMLFEDGFKSVLLKELEKKGLLTGDDGNTIIHDIRFSYSIIDTNNMVNDLQFLCVGLNSAPPIYTIPLPTGKANPFVSDYARIDISKVDTELVFRPILYVHSKVGGKNNFAVYEPLPNSNTAFDFHTILDIMVEQFRVYFEGDAVGWKDKHGNIIESISVESTKCTGAGFDPAL